MAARVADVAAGVVALADRPRRPRTAGSRADEPGGAFSFQGYRHLAMRVIDQALRDVAGPGCTPCDRESARAFLADSPMLHLWCAVASVSPRQLPTGQGRRARRPAHPPAPPPPGSLADGS